MFPFWKVETSIASANRGGPLETSGAAVSAAVAEGSGAAAAICGTGGMWRASGGACGFLERAPRRNPRPTRQAVPARAAPAAATERVFASFVVKEGAPRSVAGHRRVHLARDAPVAVILRRGRAARVGGGEGRHLVLVPGLVRSVRVELPPPLPGRARRGRRGPPRLP